MCVGVEVLILSLLKPKVEQVFSISHVNHLNPVVPSVLFSQISAYSPLGSLQSRMLKNMNNTEKQLSVVVMTNWH